MTCIGRDKQVDLQDLQDSEAILYGTVTVGMHHHTSVKTHRVYCTKSEPSSKLGL